MITSFRLRLALLSALLSGLALAAFGVGAWWLIRDSKIDRIDGDVRVYAEREAHRQRDSAGWRHTVANLLANLGLHHPDELIVLIQDGDGVGYFRSPHWPTGLDDAQWPWPQATTPALSPEPRRDDPVDARRPPPMEHAPDNDLPHLPHLPPHPPPHLPPYPPPDGMLEPLASPPPHLLQNAPPPGPPPATLTLARTVDGHQWRIGLAVTARSRIAIGVDTRSLDAEMNGIRVAFLVAMPLALLVIGVGGWLFSSQAMRPLKKLIAATRQVTAEGLDSRLSSQNEDREFAELIEVFNGMLERLERSFKQAHRFSADAAHELKTPLAILQGQLERAIRMAEDGSAMQEELSSILDEVRRLSTISRKLLLLSQADAGRLNVHREAFDLSKSLVDLLEDTRMLAPQLQISGEIQPNIRIAADGSLLRQVLHNLISNAIKYNVEPGWIRISTALTPGRVEVRVANSSPGIPPAERGKIFERFFRADPAHSRHIEGVGLGLSVSREIARAHNGDIVFKVEDSGAVEFALLLPRD